MRLIEISSIDLYLCSSVENVPFFPIAALKLLSSSVLSSNLACYSILILIIELLKYMGL